MTYNSRGDKYDPLQIWWTFKDIRNIFKALYIYVIDSILLYKPSTKFINKWNVNVI